MALVFNSSVLIVNTEYINYHDLDQSLNNSAQIYIFRVWPHLEEGLNGVNR